jgi:hypothetical protein
MKFKDADYCTMLDAWPKGHEAGIAVELHIQLLAKSASAFLCAQDLLILLLYRNLRRCLSKVGNLEKVVHNGELGDRCSAGYSSHSMVPNDFRIVPITDATTLSAVKLIEH